jgi:hypothetical protein
LSFSFHITGYGVFCHFSVHPLTSAWKGNGVSSKPVG